MRAGGRRQGGREGRRAADAPPSFKVNNRGECQAGIDVPVTPSRRAVTGECDNYGRFVGMLSDAVDRPSPAPRHCQGDA